MTAMRDMVACVIMAQVDYTERGDALPYTNRLCAE